MSDLFVVLGMLVLTGLTVLIGRFFVRPDPEKKSKPPANDGSNF